MDELPESVDLEPVRLDKPVEYAGRVQRFGFREGLLVAGAIVVILAGAGVVAIGAPAKPRPSASLLAVAPTPPSTPTSTSVPSPTLGPSPTPAATPAVTPAGTCSGAALVAPPPVLLLSRGEQTPGTMSSPYWDRDRPSSVGDAVSLTVPLGQPLILSVDYHACALAWRILVGDRVVQEQTNPTMDPAYARQGYFTVLPPALMGPDTILELDMRFTSGWTGSRWSLTTSPSAIPQAFVVAGEGATFASPGCGFTVQLQDGASATESCEGWSFSDLGAGTLYVEPSTPLTFRVPDAGFSGASTGAVACGRIKGSPGAFVVDPTCEVEPGLSAARDVTFNAPPDTGVWTIAIEGCATQVGGSACGAWYVTVDTAHPEPTGFAGP